ncbi:hypothetical protein TPA0906_65480 [Streptomyces olivaceus]|nr:hypothetical protein TPA0906_65480 [Streptomyces olivaceus]
MTRHAAGGAGRSRSGAPGGPGRPGRFKDRRAESRSVMNDSEGQRTMPPDLSSPPWALREYAVLADGERGAVLDPRGRIVWLCAPRWHDDAVFSALVGGAGHFAVEPADPWHVWGGSYD